MRGVGAGGARTEGPASLLASRVVTREQNLYAATILSRFYPCRPRDVLFIGTAGTGFAQANVRWLSRIYSRLTLNPRRYRCVDKRKLENLLDGLSIDRGPGTPQTEKSLRCRPNRI